MHSDQTISGKDAEIQRDKVEREKSPSDISSERPYTVEPIRGGNMRVVENMEASLGVPTATSYRTIPVKLLEENRKIINEYRDAEGKNRVSFTHLISWAIVCALKNHPGINASFDLIDGAPHRRPG